MTRVILGTRGSALALAQAELTESALQHAVPGVEVARRIFVTRGDQKLGLSLLRAGEAGGKGLFTRELEDALLDGTIDVAVHSLKDLPGTNPPRLQITAVLPRASTADILVTKRPGGFALLPAGARLGTSSIRRARQIQWKRPDLAIEEWRGNVPTRLRKLAERDDLAGIVLAQAGLERLGYDLSGGHFRVESESFHLDSLATVLLPAIGQGAIALQSRVDRATVSDLLREINHPPTLICVRGEREVQRLLAGDCALPVGVRSTLDGACLDLEGILFKPDAREPATAHASGDAANPERVGVALFRALTAG